MANKIKKKYKIRLNKHCSDDYSMFAFLPTVAYLVTKTSKSINFVWFRWDLEIYWKNNKK